MYRKLLLSADSYRKIIRARYVFYYLHVGMTEFVDAG